jgi:hypothetical protein
MISRYDVMYQNPPSSSSSWRRVVRIEGGNPTDVKVKKEDMTANINLGAQRMIRKEGSELLTTRCMRDPMPR